MLLSWRLLLASVLLGVLTSYVCFGHQAPKNDVLVNPSSGHISAADEDDEYYDPTHLRYENYVYKDNIQTVLLHRKEYDLSLPVLTLGTDEQLHLEFDDLGDEVKDYAFEFIHCSANWEPSDFMTMEFCEGMPYDYITNYGLSRNTLQTYTHYNLFFPYSGMTLTKSGNYIIKVYEEDDPETWCLRGVLWCWSHAFGWKPACTWPPMWISALATRR